MQDLNEDKIQEIVIDFEEWRSKKLDEGIYSSMGAMIKMTLDSMFGVGFLPMNLRVKGTQREVDSFIGALGSEKRYIQSARDFGLNSPRTYKNKNFLNNAVKGFEKATGLKWPFK